MPTSFSVFQKPDYEISITYATQKAKKCLQLSNPGIRLLCIFENIGFDNIGEAVHLYKHGMTEDS